MEQPMFTEEILNTKSLKELTDIYNDPEIRGASPERAKMRDKSSAIKLILLRQQQNAEVDGGGATVPAPSEEGKNDMKNTSKKSTKKKAAAPKKKKAAKSTEGRARKLFDFPAAKEIKAHREGTARDKAVKCLLKGATFAEVQKATGWTLHRHCYEGIRLLNTHLGYGIKEDDKGVIKLFTK